MRVESVGPHNQSKLAGMFAVVEAISYHFATTVFQYCIMYSRGDAQIQSSDG